jgi:predicted Rossmann fold flavoprotein
VPDANGRADGGVLTSPAANGRERYDVIVVGAGAAGLATALFTARASARLRVGCLDGARHLGAKILVSGGSRCNVTNRDVTERDFWGGSPRVVRAVLRAFPAARAAAFFEALGVALCEEEDGKLFPATQRSRTVLEALLGEAARLGVAILRGERVADVQRDPARGTFLVDSAGGRRFEASKVVLATGGRSLPRTGSDGFGYELARRLGHGYVETTPALVPLVLDGTRHVALTGVSHQASLRLVTSGGTTTFTRTGALLWTHFGISGPVALDMSRHWLRAGIDGDRPVLALSLCPGQTFETLDAWLVEGHRDRRKARVTTVLAERMPAAVASYWLAEAGIDAGTTMAHLARDDRRRLVHALLETKLEVRASRGYTYAEVTAGGVPLEEIESATMASRICPGLYLTGEILDVDGRLGGFNFQWAWSSAWVAGQALAAALAGRELWRDA